jgi:hypothetical protein
MDAIPGAQGLGSPEGDSVLTAMGEGRYAPGAVFDRGTHEEDGPGTWQALIPPRGICGFAGSR